MHKSLILITLPTVFLLAQPLPAFAQAISNFATPQLKVGGGDANFSDTRSTMFSGWISVSSSGAISGTIVRRNFNNGQSNSTLPAAQLAVASGSKIFGPVSLDGKITNSWTNEYGSDVRVTTYYSADFYIGTANPSFFVKGRAQQELNQSTNISFYTTSVQDPQNPISWITITNVTTNIWSGSSVSLGGVSFGAVGLTNSPAIRGAFLADEPEN